MKSKSFNLNTLNKKNIKAYDATVEEYYKNTKRIDKAEFEVRKNFIRLLHKNAHVLDLACGPGRDCKYFSDKGFQIMGMDLSQKSLTKAKKIAPRATFKRVDLEHLDLPKDSFDAVWFNAGIVAVPKKYAKSILKNVYETLKTNGVLHINAKEGIGEGFELDKRYAIEKYYAYYSKKEIEVLLKKAKFKILKKYRPEIMSAYNNHQWIAFLCKK